MDETPLRIDLLRLVCAALPPSDADAISRLDPHDPDTHIAAYAAVMRTETRLPDDLHRSFCAQFARAPRFLGVVPPQDEPTPREIPAQRFGAGRSRASYRPESQEAAS